MAKGPADHPLRVRLTNEVHARPYAQLQPPERATFLAVLSGVEGEEADRAHVAALCRHYGAAEPGPGANHLMVDLGPFRLKWERRTEFSTYSFFQRTRAPGAPFENPVIDLVPHDWFDAIPGERLVGVHMELEPREAPERSAEELANLFGAENFASAGVAGGAARATMDFAINADGYGRLLVQDIDLQPRQAGRLCQRLFEIEAYRMMALLAFPLAQQHGPTLSRAAERLAATTEKMTAIDSLAEQRALLDALTALSIEVERVAAATEYRFGAARAYFALVERRIRELREERLAGYQTFGEFMDRRLSPAMRSCEAVGAALDRLSRRLARASQLLRARVDIQLEAQNQDLLQSMNRRARLQLRLQQTVEGLSVAAISYYLVGLVGYGAKALHVAGRLALDPALVTGAAIPVVVLLAFFGVHQIRRRVTRADAAEKK